MCPFKNFCTGAKVCVYPCEDCTHEDKDLGYEPCNSCFGPDACTCDKPRIYWEPKDAYTSH